MKQKTMSVAERLFLEEVARAGSRADRKLERRRRAEQRRVEMERTPLFVDDEGSECRAATRSECAAFTAVCLIGCLFWLGMILLFTRG